MTGRTLYVIGNSVARQNAFNMIEMLGGNPTKREDQRDQCPKNEGTWDDSCHNEMAGVKIRYLFLQFLDGFYYDDRGGFPFFRYQKTSSDGSIGWETGRIAYNGTSADGRTVRKYFKDPKEGGADPKAEIWAEDNCINHDVRSCLARFFAGSTERDVLTFTLGMTYDLRPTGEEPTTNPGIDHAAWLTASAAAFKGHIAATFKGQVFRATMAEFNSNGYVASRTPILGRVNNLLQDIWKPGSEDLPWYTIDQWPINKNRHYLYNDHVHFNGILTFALLHQVLNELCPGGGKTTWTINNNNRNGTTTLSEILRDKTYVLRLATGHNNYWLMILWQGARHNVPNMDTYNGLEVPPDRIIDVGIEDLKLFPEGPPLEPCDPAYVPNVCVTSVYYKALHTPH